MFVNITLFTSFILILYAVQCLIFYVGFSKQDEDGVATLFYTVSLVLNIGFFIGIFVNLAWLSPLN